MEGILFNYGDLKIGDDSSEEEWGDAYLDGMSIYKRSRSNSIFFSL